jgi:hypothetical protein
VSLHLRCSHPESQVAVGANRACWPGADGLGRWHMSHPRGVRERSAPALPTCPVAPRLTRKRRTNVATDAQTGGLAMCCSLHASTADSVLQVGCSEFVAVFHTAKQPSADITISFMHTGRLFICESSSEPLVRMLPRVTGTWGWVHRPAVSLEHGYLSALAAWSPIGSEQVFTAPRLRVHAGAYMFRAAPCVRTCMCQCCTSLCVRVCGSEGGVHFWWNASN